MRTDLRLRTPREARAVTATAASSPRYSEPGRQAVREPSSPQARCHRHTTARRVGGGHVDAAAPARLPDIEAIRGLMTGWIHRDRGNWAGTSRAIPP